MLSRTRGFKAKKHTLRGAAEGKEINKGVKVVNATKLKIEVVTIPSVAAENPASAPSSSAGAVAAVETKDDVEARDVEPETATTTTTTIAPEAPDAQEAAITDEAAIESERQDLEIKARTKQLYSIFHKKTGTLGGGGSGGAIYGEVTLNSMQAIIDSLTSKCGMDKDSVFMDIGAGLGKPNLHAAVTPGVKLSLGVELMGGRWWQSMMMMETLLAEPKFMETAERVFLAHADVTAIDTFNPVTHLYSFNRGFPPYAMESIGKAFHKSTTCEYFLCFNKERELENYGFDVSLVDIVTTKMAGSGEQHRCFVYRRNDSERLTGISDELASSPASSVKSSKKINSNKRSEEEDDAAAAAAVNLSGPSPARTRRGGASNARARAKLEQTKQMTDKMKKNESTVGAVEANSDEIESEEDGDEVKSTSNDGATGKDRAAVEADVSEAVCEAVSESAIPSLSLRDTLKAWKFVPPPMQAEFAPHVERSITYYGGKEAMAVGGEVYMGWIKDQVGLSRSKRNLRVRKKRGGLR